MTGAKARDRLSVTFSIAVCLFAGSAVRAGPLHDAVSSGNLVLLEELLAGDAAVDESDWVVGSALHVAVNRGDVDSARILLEHGAEPDAASEIRGASALGIAASFGDTAMIELLLEHGADPEFRDQDGMTALLRAAQKGQTRTVVLLADHGANVDARQTDTGSTPIMWASENGYTETVRALVQAGSEIDALNHSGFSALMLAAQLQSFRNAGDGRLIEFLVGAGADPQRKNEFGQTPREYAVSRGAEAWREIADVLERIEVEK